MGWRPRIVSAKVSAGADGAGRVARVVLTGPKGEHVEASWIDQGTGPVSRRRAIGQAAVHAIAQCLPSRYSLLLESVSALKIGSRRVVTAVIRVSSPESEEVLTGAVLTSDDPELAVVKAVLDALNRRLERLRLDVPAEEGSSAET